MIYLDHQFLLILTMKLTYSFLFYSQSPITIFKLAVSLHQMLSLPLLFIRLIRLDPKLSHQWSLLLLLLLLSLSLQLLHLMVERFLLPLSYRCLFLLAN